MVGAYVRFKCNYAALRKYSDNQQQSFRSSLDLYSQAHMVDATDTKSTENG